MGCRGLWHLRLGAGVRGGCCGRKRRPRLSTTTAAAAAVVAAALLTVAAAAAAAVLFTQRRQGSSEPPLPPPTPEPELNTWVVIAAEAGSDAAEVCHAASVDYTGWTVLIYGARNFGQNSVSRCRYAPPADSQEWGPLGGATAGVLQGLSARRRALLYAIKNGAEAIFVAGDGCRSSHPPVFTGRVHHGLRYSSPGHPFHGRAHFGCRPAPGDPPPPPPTTIASYRLCRLEGSPALQVLTSGLPTAPVEVRRKDRKDPYRAAPCDPRAPAVTLADDTLADLRLQHALFTSAAFWALGSLPEEEPPFVGGCRTADDGDAATLMVGYALQRLLTLAGARVSVRYDKKIVDRTNATTPTHRRLYTNKVRQTVLQWACNHSHPRIDTCARDLFSHLAAVKLLQPHLVNTLAPWWAALEALGYQSPLLGERVNSEYCHPEAVRYQPAFLQAPFPWRPYRSVPYLPLANQALIRRTIDQTCRGFRIRSHPQADVNLTHSWGQISNVLLVITFNAAHYEALPYVEALYRPFFPYMAYCGPGLPDLRRRPELRDFRLTFLSYAGTPGGQFPGSLNYQCVTMATRLGLAVDGYLVIADDMFVSVARLVELPRDRMWHVPLGEMRSADARTLLECRLGQCNFHPHWRWWEDYQSEILAALSDLQRRARQSRLFSRCSRQLLREVGGQDRVFGAYSDIYYVPGKLAVEVADLLEHFRRHQVFLEVAVPTVFRCLEDSERLVGLRGLQLWEMSRDAPYQHFNTKDFLAKVYLHPTKWSSLAGPGGNRSMAEFYCTRLLPHIHDPFGRTLD